MSRKEVNRACYITASSTFPKLNYLRAKMHNMIYIIQYSSSLNKSAEFLSSEKYRMHFCLLFACKDACLLQ